MTGGQWRYSDACRRAERWNWFYRPGQRVRYTNKQGIDVESVTTDDATAGRCGTPLVSMRGENLPVELYRVRAA